MDGNNSNLKLKVLSGLFWKFGERILAQGVSFIISLKLATILVPEQYGTIAMVLVFINIANVFVSDGLGASLIQKQDSNDLDFSTMFYCSTFFALILYIIIFFSSPFIAAFYNNNELVPIIRVMALQVPISSVKNIQHAYVSKHMMFKKYFWSTLGGTIISGVVGIIMAYHGLGVWALVEQYLVNSFVDMCVLFVTVPWRPKKMFSFHSAGTLLGYSWKLLFATLINTIYGECRSLIIGKKYSDSDLAYNTKGNQFPNLIISNINTAISTILFPAFSIVGNDYYNLKKYVKKSIKNTSYVIFPLMVGMFVISEPMIRLLLKDKWLPCVPFLRITCIYYLFQPCLTANNEALKAVGRSDICLKLEIVKKIIGFSLVVLSMNISVLALAISNVVFAFISMIINIYPVKKILGYGYFEQLWDMSGPLLMSCIMAVSVYLVSFLGFSDLVTICIQCFVGGLIYIILSIVLKSDSFGFIYSTVKTHIFHR